MEGIVGNGVSATAKVSHYYGWGQRQTQQWPWRMSQTGILEWQTVKQSRRTLNLAIIRAIKVNIQVKETWSFMLSYGFIILISMHQMVREGFFRSQRVYNRKCFFKLFSIIPQNKSVRKVKSHLLSFVFLLLLLFSITLHVFIIVFKYFHVFSYTAIYTFFLRLTVFYLAVHLYVDLFVVSSS